MKTMLISLIVSIFLSSSCNSSKQTSTPESKPVAAQTTATAQPQKADDNYRLIISFISIGEGTDPNAREMMQKILDSWEEKKGEPIEMENMPWGREGEVDFCFNLKELDEKEQVAFADEIKSAFKGKQLIQITENQPCIHKR